MANWLIESVTNVLRRASFWLCEQVYPLIPKLYEIVEVLAKYTFFTDETINKISRNIYILVSVLMLFALGTKLLSAIVNPENFSGDKGSKGKSFKATFFRAVASVFLIILTPMFFNTAYEVQDHVISNSLVERILLGVDLEGDTSGGQILAGYSFSTFCHPSNEDVTSIEQYNEVITQNIDKIGVLEFFINQKSSSSAAADYIDGVVDPVATGSANVISDVGNGVTNIAVSQSTTDSSTGNSDKLELEFNGLLCPAVGILILYELILLAMDLGLRSVKLGLLQLMSPIVIASYIFKGEILSKWFKEVITTYLICFLKIAAITFMVFGMTELSGFLSRPELDPLSSGAKRITQLFIMIGLLQVIKLIPTIINGIFGTKIESRGGIKGRLGEMAAVGGIAAKAWDALKTPATKIAGLGLAAAGLGPLGLLGAGAAGWAAHKTWNKGWGNKGPLKDTKFGRAARTIGAGGSAVGTALTTKGGLFKSIGAGKKKYDDSEVTKTRRLERAHKNRSNAFTNFDIGDNGLLNSINDINSALANGKINENQAKTLNELLKKGNLDVNQKATLEDVLKTGNINGNQAKILRKIAAQTAFDYVSENAKNTYRDAKGIGFPGSNKIADDQEILKYSASNKAHGDIVKKKDESVNNTLDEMIRRASSEGNINLAAKLSKMKSDKVTGQLSMPQLIYDLNQMLKNGEGVSEGDYKKIKADGSTFWNELNSKQYVSFDKEGNVIKDKDGNIEYHSLLDLIPHSSEGGHVITDLYDKLSTFDTDLDSKKSSIDKKVAEYNYNDEQKEIVAAVTNNIITTATALAGADSKIDYAQTPVRNPGDPEFIGPLPPDSAPQQQPAPQPAPQQGTQQQAPVPGDANFAGSQPAPQQSGIDNPESQRDGSYTPGVYSGNVGDINVNTNVDLSELGTKLDTINDSVKNSGDKVSSAINTQGENISEKLNQSNERLKHIHSGITHVDTQIGEMNSNVDSINDKINKANDDE